MGIREDVKKGVTTAKDAYEALYSKNVSRDAPIMEWLLRRMGRLPTPPPGKFHTTKKGKKGYTRKPKHKKGIK